MDEEKLIARIAALMAKTEEAGATESEALAAAEKARELIDKHQIDVRRVAEHANRSGTKITSDERVFHPALRKKRFHEIAKIFSVIGRYCDVVVLVSEGGAKHDTITIVGEPLDCRLAYFMISNLRCAVDRECRLRKIPKHRQRAFIRGAVMGVGRNILDMVDRRMSKHQSTGTELVATKLKSASDAVDQMFPNAPTKKHRKSKIDAVFMDGYRAGGEIPIQQGLETAEQAQLIK